MTKFLWEISSEFECTGASGRLYTVYERTKILQFSDLSGGISNKKGIKDYVTKDGMGLNLLTDGSFQIVITDEILRRT